MGIGLLQEGLNWLSGGNEFRVNESKCMSMGDEVCEYIIQKTPIG
jgi:predicted hydrocarbon binding protein